MTKRPLSVTIVSVLFLAVGSASLVRGVVCFARDPPGDGRVVDLALVVISALLAITGGAFVLRGRAWARWMCAAWLGAHVVLSILHGWAEVAVHGALFAVVSLLLFRPSAAVYFRPAPAASGAVPDRDAAQGR